MRVTHSRRRLLAALLTPAAAGTALLLAAGTGRALAPHGPVGDPLLFAWAVLCAAAAALHRPLGGVSLGIGAMVLPPVLVLLGPVPAAGVAGGGLLVADLAHRLIARFADEPRRVERRRLRRSVEAASEALLAALAAGSAWTLVAPGSPLSMSDSTLYDATAAGAAAYLLIFLGLRLLAQKRDRPHRRADALSVLRPLGLDLAGWCGGVAVAVAASTEGAVVAGAVLAISALLALEALRNARLSDRSRRRASELEEVSRAGQRVVAPTGELAPLVESIRRECAKILEFAWFQCELVDGGDGKSWFAGWQGELQVGDPQPERSPPARPGFHKRPTWRILTYPLAVEGRSLGRLRLWCDPRALEEREVDLLEALLPQLAASVHRALLDHEARHDPLTGLAVRRELERRLGEIFEGCSDAGEEMAVVMCDLDHFKRINDTYGHTAGDRALIEVARELAARSRDGDLCCRYGGEEFILLLEATDGATALAMAERLRRNVEELRLVVEGVEIPLTLSAGVAAYPELYIRSADELPLLADAALYEAKRRGRNLCLLNLGRGRYRTPGGEVLANPVPEAPAPPRLFA